jgi:hypothetical protein
MCPAQSLDDDAPFANEDNDFIKAMIFQ